MARSAIQNFRVAAKATREETQKALVALAKREHGKIMRAEPQPRRFTRVVDGKVGAPEEAVRPDGMIVYRYHRLEEVVRVAMDTLFDLSPVLSGEYRNAHSLFVDGAAASNLAGWDGQGEIVILNPLPYARKIEMGKMTMRVSGTDHVYEQAAAILKKRFGNQALIKFTFRSAMMSYVGMGKRGSVPKGSAKRSAHNMETASRVPALVINPR